MTPLEKIRAEILTTFLWDGEDEKNLNTSVRKCLEIIDKYAEEEYRQKIFSYLDGVADGLSNPIEQEPCEDAVSRQAVLEKAYDMSEIDGEHFTEPCMVVDVEDIQRLPSVQPKAKHGHCKDCKWWKDKDGVYRRGFDAESKCPINRKVVFEGNGYCYMFEPQESEDKE